MTSFPANSGWSAILHELSERAGGSFVPQDCGVFTESLRREEIVGIADRYLRANGVSCELTEDALFRLRSHDWRGKDGLIPLHLVDEAIRNQQIGARQEWDEAGEPPEPNSFLSGAVAVARCALALACLAVAAGCEADPEPLPGPIYHTRDSAGIVIAMNSGVPAGGERWSVDAEPMVVIGGADGPPPTLFTVVTRASRLSDGTIVVLENETSELRFFDPGGAHLRTAGGFGEGPGEFEYAQGFVRLAGDTLLVDAGERHLVFSPTGDYIRQTRIDVERHFSGERGVPCAHSRLLPEGSFLVCEVVSDESPAVRGAVPPARVIRVAPDGREAVLGHYWYRWGVLRAGTWIASGGSPPVVAIAPNPEYSIEVWSLDGDLTRIIRRLDGRRAPTDKEVAAAVADMQRFGGPGAPGCADDQEPPDLVPAVFGMTVGITGDVWIRREPFVPMHDETVFDVFDGQGRFRGEVRFEGYFWLYEVGEDYVLGARLDELEVAHVQLHRLSRRGAMGR